MKENLGAYMKLNKWYGQLLPLYFVLLSLSLSAQYTPFTEYTTLDGLPSDHIYMVIQDSMGYYWIGTDNGLVRYDGYDFKVYTVEDGLPSNDVYELHQDKWGRIWLFEGSLQIVYMDKKEKFHKLGIDNEELQQNVLNKAVGYYLFQIDNRLLLTLGSTSKNNSKQDVFEIDKSDKLRYLSNAREIPFVGFYFYSIKESVTFKIKNLYDNTIKFRDLKVFAFDNFFTDSLLFINDRQNQILYIKNEYNDNVLTEILDYNYLGNASFNFKSLKGKREGEFYINIGNDVFEYNNSKKSIKKLKFFHKKDININRVFFDKSDNLWICNNKGLRYVNSWFINNEVIKLDGNFEDIEIDDQSETVFTNDSDNTIYEISSTLEIQTVKDKVLTHQMEDICFHNESLYIGHFNTGLSLIRNKKLNINITKDFNSPDSILYGISNLVKKMEFIGQDSLVCLNAICLSFVDLKNRKAETYKRGKYNNLKYQTSTELIWATKKDGIEIYKSSKLVKKIDLHLVNITHISELDKDRMIISNSDGVTYVCDTTGCESFALLKGIKVESIEIDQDSVWLLQKDQLIKMIVDKSDIENSKLERLIPEGVFGKGIKFNEIKLGANKMYISSNNGFYKLNRHIKSYEKKSIPLEIIKISSDTVVFKEDKLNYIPYYLNSITVDYSTIFAESGDITYHYKLEGVDNKYVSTNSRSVRYPELNYGSYKFHIYALDEENNTSEIKELEFRILTPWYHTWPFRIFIVMLSLYLAYLVYKRQINEIKKIAAEKSIINQKFAELELNALQSQMNPHFIFNTLNGLQNLVQDKNFDLAGTYIVRFSKLMRLFLESSKQKYIELGEELEIVRIYIELEQLRFQSRLNFKLENKLSIEELEMSIPSTILQPFAENAINHGLFHKKTNGTLTIILYSDVEYIYIDIIDNGIGRAAANVINSKNKIGHKSFAIDNINGKIDTLKKLNQFDINYEIVDLIDKEGSPLGTKVSITLKKEI